jgi:phage terminase large subunit-like protein
MSEAEDLEVIEQALRFHKLGFYRPYPKQREFHRLGADNRERGLIAANRVGKSECAAAETAMHLTGEYPSWWDGYRFAKPITAWAAGGDGELTRDVIQQKLCGKPGVIEEFGTGYIPRYNFIDRPSLARGTTDLYDTVHVRHKSGGVSALTFKTYGEGRAGFQATTLDWIWLDEEPDDSIYSEGLTRLATTQGLSVLTCTPLKGRTSLIKRIKYDFAPGRAFVNMGIFDAGHFTKEQAEAEIARYPEHERDARAYGVEQLGEGRVFLTDDRLFAVPRPDFIPPAWAKLGAVDFGGAGSGSHPFAYVLIAWDRDFDVIYLLQAIKLQGMTMLQHIPKIRQIAANVPVAWPHDGNEKDRGGSGLSIAQQYKNPMPGMLGLNMLPTHATWPEGGFSTEAAVSELDDRTKTGRFLVCEDLGDFFDEYRQYHREKGLLVKIQDDILSAVFKALMMKRFARVVSLGDDPHGNAARLRQSGQARDMDPFTGMPI